jgi:L-fuculose-phosphate aldolase
MLDCLENDIIEVPLAGSSPLDEKASMELPMHRAIYRDTGAQAVIHGHTPYAVALSLLSAEDYIEENTCECRYVLGKIPIIDGAPASQELAENAARALKDARGAIIRGHGPVVRGSDFKDAFVALASIEFTAQVKYLKDLARHA